VPGMNRHGNLIPIVRVLAAPPIAINFILCEAFCFYVFYFVLFPRFLFTKKFFLLFLSGIATCVLCACICLLLTSSLYSITHELPVQEKMIMILFVALLSSIHGIIGLVMKGFITWYADIKLKEELNRKNYETELELVKSQINPHFLFNTINNIDVLILKDGEKASAFLNKLSGIMRFMLYETKTEKIPLQKELDYIKNYIDLQRIRTSNPDYVHYNVSGDTQYLQIAPMLFIPFIENAFTYADDNKSENSIRINFEINDKELYFTCENKYNQSVTKAHGGLGNELILKRLALMYPKDHKLTITDENGTYTVKLVLYFHAA
jgi:two-component system LytT family sensor kinase